MCTFRYTTSTPTPSHKLVLDSRPALFTKLANRLDAHATTKAIHFSPYQNSDSPQIAGLCKIVDLFSMTILLNIDVFETLSLQELQTFRCSLQ